MLARFPYKQQLYSRLSGEHLALPMALPRPKLGVKILGLARYSKC